MIVVDDQFTARAQAHLARVLELDGFRIHGLEQISGGGLSRTVVRFDATGDAAAVPQSYVMLLEQESSPVEPNRDAEYGILRALAGHPGVKVPLAHWVESDPEPLGAPFLLGGLLPGTSDPKELLGELAPHARQVIEDSFATLGALAAVPVDDLDLGPAFRRVEPGEAWAVELERCEAVIGACGCAGEAVTSAAFRHLRRNPPPAASTLSVVHGDYRLGNYMFDASGLTGVIDWEMVHLGDAVEDLAWSLLPIWEFASIPGRTGGVMSRAEAVALWEGASGLRADPRALAWWTIFCHLKLISLWATARHIFSTNDRAGIVPGLVSYASIQRDESQLVGLLRGVAS